MNSICDIDVNIKKRPQHMLHGSPVRSRIPRAYLNVSYKDSTKKLYETCALCKLRIAILAASKSS